MNNPDNFYPILTAITKEKRPHQITFYALSAGRFKTIKLPKRLHSVSLDRKELIIKWFARKYLNRFNGVCPFWGEVIAFEYMDCFSCYSVNIDASLATGSKDYKGIDVKLDYLFV